VRIQVTAEHIKKGQIDEAMSCPIALALEGAGIVEPWVTGQLIVCGELGLRETLIPTLQIREFICAFDRSEPVMPFEFEFDELQPGRG